MWTEKKWAHLFPVIRIIPCSWSVNDPLRIGLVVPLPKWGRGLLTPWEARTISKIVRGGKCWWSKSLENSRLLLISINLKPLKPATWPKKHGTFSYRFSQVPTTRMVDLDPHFSALHQGGMILHQVPPNAPGSTWRLNQYSCKGSYLSLLGRLQFSWNYLEVRSGYLGYVEVVTRVIITPISGLYVPKS